MHCHSKEGSLDGKLPIHDFVEVAIERGFHGILISDHNSYRGYRKWVKEEMQRDFPDFVLLKGIEYDTIDAGHILCILPDDVDLRILEFKGFPVSILIDLVHYYGGILGPAHPFGDKYLSFIDTMMRHKQQTVMQRFDFVEGFNACEGEESNRRAMVLAEKYGKPTFGGSDAHRENCVGLAYTIFPEEVRCNDDLIACVKQRGKEIACGGSYYHGPVKQHMGISHAILMKLFWAYNRLGALIRRRGRNREIRNLYLQEILHKHTDS